jgi:hypothetical protein
MASTNLAEKRRNFGATCGAFLALKIVARRDDSRAGL